jgi:hypothetical protein
MKTVIACLDQFWLYVGTGAIASSLLFEFRRVQRFAGQGEMPERFAQVTSNT